MYIKHVLWPVIDCSNLHSIELHAVKVLFYAW